jgi:hypothetical protein
MAPGPTETENDEAIAMAALSTLADSGTHLAENQMVSSLGNDSAIAFFLRLYDLFYTVSLLFNCCYLHLTVDCSKQWLKCIHGIILFEYYSIISWPFSLCFLCFPPSSSKNHWHLHGLLILFGVKTHTYFLL